VNNNNGNSESDTAVAVADGTDNDTTSGTQQVGCPTNQVMQTEDSAATMMDDTTAGRSGTAEYTETGDRMTGLQPGEEYW
jgi:hypothetical protein